MTSTTLTIRVDEADQARLDQLARSTGKSRSDLAAEALSEFLSMSEWQIAGVEAAIRDLDRGERFDHDDVRKWVESWDSESELKAPDAS